MIAFIEKFMRAERKVLFDFFDSNAFQEFAKQARGVDAGLNLQKTRSLILIENYYGKRLREGSYYRILPGSLEYLEFQPYANSSLLGYQTKLGNNGTDIFGITFRPGFFDLLGLFPSEQSIPKVPCAKKVELVVHDVGQGNWNEIVMDGRVALVYDFGCTYTDSPQKMRGLLDSSLKIYRQDKPILVISHWDFRSLRITYGS